MPTPNESDEVLRAADEACREGRHWETRWLLCKWRPDPRYNRGKTPMRELLLHRVVEKGYVALIRDLLPKRNPIKDELVWDAIRGEAPIPVLELFLARGWEVNSKSEHTALNHAVSQHNEILVDWLLARGADPNRHNDHVGAPLVRAACYGHLHMVKSLIKHGANFKDTDVLAWVTSNKDGTVKPLEMMEYLLDVGVDVNYVQKGQTPPKAHINLFLGTALHHALRTRDVRRLELLLARGADWTLKDVKGFTPLEKAKRYRYVESIRILAPLENPTLQVEDEMEEELKRIGDTWLREDKERENEGVLRGLQEERKRASALLRQQMHHQDEAVEKLLAYDTSCEDEGGCFLGCNFWDGTSR